MSFGTDVLQRDSKTSSSPGEIALGLPAILVPRLDNVDLFSKRQRDQIRCEKAPSFVAVQLPSITEYRVSKAASRKLRGECPAQMRGSALACAFAGIRDANNQEAAMQTIEGLGLLRDYLLDCTRIGCGQVIT
jgi:hypothetical protein